MVFYYSIIYQCFKLLILLLYFQIQVLSCNSFKGLRFYYQLYLVLQAFPFPNYLILTFIIFIGQYYIFFFFWICYRQLLQIQSYQFYPLRYPSVKNYFSYNIIILGFWTSVKCQLYIQLVFLYFSSFRFYIVLTRNFLFYFLNI